MAGWEVLTDVYSPEVCVGGGVLERWRGGEVEVSCWGVVVSRCWRGVLLVSGSQRPLAARAGWLYNHRSTDWCGPGLGAGAGQQDLVGGQSAQHWDWKGQRGCNYSSVTSCPPGQLSVPGPAQSTVHSSGEERLYIWPGQPCQPAQPAQPAPATSAGRAETVALHQSLLQLEKCRNLNSSQSSHHQSYTGTMEHFNTLII